MGGDQGDDQYEDNHEDSHDARSSGGPVKPEEPEPTARRVTPWADPPDPDVPPPNTGATLASSSPDDEEVEDERFEPL